MDPSPSFTFTISAYLISKVRASSKRSRVFKAVLQLIAVVRVFLLGELDVVEDDEGTFDVEDGSVVDSGSDVVVSCDSLHVCVCSHFFVQECKIDKISSLL